jgi:hypothetical protein
MYTYPINEYFLSMGLKLASKHIPREKKQKQINYILAYLETMVN